MNQRRYAIRSRSMEVMLGRAGQCSGDVMLNPAESASLASYGVASKRLKCCIDGLI
jgi:hypothetical protein